jgi:hypothetical protein
MPTTNPTRAAVQRSLLKGKTMAECLAALDNVCAAAAACSEVQASPIGVQAAAVLQKTVTAAHGDLTTKMALAQALLAAAKALNIDFVQIKGALGAYEAAVGVIADGNASVINKAGLPSRDLKAPPTALGKVAVVHSKVGTHPMEAILSWPKGPGATGYAIEVNFTPQSPDGTWVAQNPGSGRRRIVTGPTPGCQFLARVASLGSDGTQSDWSDAILATAL